MKQSCTTFQPISQQTVLAMLQAPSTIPIKPGQIAYYTDANGLTHEILITSVNGGNVTFNLSTGIITVPRSKITFNTTECFLDKIPLSEWKVISFDPSTKIVCVDVISASGTRHLSITLPVLSVSGS